MRLLRKLIAAACFGTLFFVWNHAVSSSSVSSNEEVFLEIAVTEDGSGFVCTPRKILHVIKKQSEDSKVPGYVDEEYGVDAVGAKSLKAFKNNVYYVLNGELWQLTKGRLIGNDEIVKTMGSKFAIQLTAIDANGQIYLLVTDENSRSAILKRNQNGNLTKLIVDGCRNDIKDPVSMTIAGESSLLIQ